jgi:rubrerythrin
MSKPMSDSGKGSFRRNEDLNKVNEGFDRIFGLSKLEQRLKKEQEESMINEEHEHDDSEWCCDVCGGPMYRQPHWGYAQCDDCGARQELIDDDYV